MEDFRHGRRIRLPKRRGSRGESCDSLPDCTRATSIAAAFNAPKPPAITYYLARSPVEAFSLNGIDSYLPGSRAYTGVANYQIFSGVPKIGEFYAHELRTLFWAGFCRASACRKCLTKRWHCGWAAVAR